ncbi:MAG TPA: hypothetical protein VN457_06225 [Chlamydiales bacterium]|nr:hypothetical protein [Chlamydiales bacterium]
MAIIPGLNYREGIYPSIDGREEVTLQAFFDHGMYIGEENQQRSTCSHVQVLALMASDFPAPQDWQSWRQGDSTPQDIQDRLWRVVQEQVPTLQGTNPAKKFLSDNGVYYIGHQI